MPIESISESRPFSVSQNSGPKTQAAHFQDVLDYATRRQENTASTAAKVGGGSASIDLREDVMKALGGLTESTKLKLHSDDREVFLETLGEVTGRTPAQVMAGLFNMNASQAAALCKALWLVADDIRGDPAVFVPMVSSLTGQPEAMMQQYLNGSRDEDEDQEKGDRQLQEAGTFDQQRGIYAVSPSLM